MNIYLNDYLKQKKLIAPMLVILWARLPLLEPPFVLYVGKTWPTYGPNMVHLKSDDMKITCYIWDLILAMFETNILPQEQTK